MCLSQVWSKVKVLHAGVFDGHPDGLSPKRKSRGAAVYSGFQIQFQQLEGRSAK